MEAKLKADELTKTFNDAKKAFHCVDEILKALEELNNKGLPPDSKVLDNFSDTFNYWEEVKSELSFCIGCSAKDNGT